MRGDVTAALLTAAGKNSTAPAYFVEIQWASSVSQLCTYGTVNWNGSTWVGGGVEVGEFTADGLPTRVVLADPTNAFRTLLSGDGVRDRRVKVWKGDVSALGVTDVVALFSGFGDGGDIGDGRVVIYIDPSSASRQFCPRDRIGPDIGINFLAPSGYRVQWGDSTLVLEPRS